MRTSFDEDAAWTSLVERVTAPSQDGFLAAVEVGGTQAYGDLPAERLRSLLPQGDYVSPTPSRAGSSPRSSPRRPPIPQRGAPLRGFFERRIAVWQPCVADAVARGELSPGTDTAAVVRAVSAPLYYQLLTHGEPPTVDDARRAARAAAAAARAAVCTEGARP